MSKEDIGSDLEIQAARHGVSIIDKGNGHFHLVGKIKVNYWPFSKGRTVFIDGPGGRKFSDCDPAEAVRIASQTPKGHNKVAVSGRRQGKTAAIKAATEYAPPKKPVNGSKCALLNPVISPELAAKPPPWNT